MLCTLIDHCRCRAWAYLPYPTRLARWSMESEFWVSHDFSTGSKMMGSYYFAFSPLPAGNNHFLPVWYFADNVVASWGASNLSRMLFSCVLVHTAVCYDCTLDTRYVNVCKSTIQTLATPYSPPAANIGPIRLLKAIWGVSNIPQIPINPSSAERSVFRSRDFLCCIETPAARKVFEKLDSFQQTHLPAKRCRKSVVFPLLLYKSPFSI